MTDAVRERAPLRSAMKLPPVRLPCGVPGRAGGMCAAAALLAVGVFFVLKSALLTVGTVAEPGPGFIPLTLGVLLCGFATAVGGGVLRDSRPAAPVELGHRDVLIVFGLLCAVPLVFESLGAYPSLGLFTAGTLILVARLTVWRAAVASLFGMVAVWFFFGRMLGLRLPPGVLEQLPGGLF